METIKVFIEIPEGTSDKYEFDEKSGELKLDFVFKDLVYPYNYGFIPDTLGEDGDALDAIVLSTKPLERGTAVDATPIGLLEMLDRGEVDNKIITVASFDPLYEKYKDVGDIPDSIKEEWKNFWQKVARQKQKTIETKEYLAKDSAMQEIKKSILNKQKTIN